LLSSVQIIAARILLEITAAELAELAKVHESTIWRVEKNSWDVAPGNVATLERILNVFEKRGVEFIDGGVRLMTKKPRVAK
jgi:transcriptional regulator with XRE-family HTH domain